MSSTMSEGWQAAVRAAAEARRFHFFSHPARGPCRIVEMHAGPALVILHALSTRLKDASVARRDWLTCHAVALCHGCVCVRSWSSIRGAVVIA